MLPSSPALDAAKAAYLRGDFAGALDALDTIGPKAGIAVYARSLEIRGWIAKSEGDFAAARECLTAALAHLGSRHQHARLEANLVTTLGYLAVESLDGTGWSEMERRGESVRWSAPGLAYWRWWFAMCRSMAAETHGRPREALTAAREAEAAAPSPAYAVLSLCRKAEVLRVYGETLGFEDHAETIRREASRLRLGNLAVFEELNAVTNAAETLALLGDGTGAAATLARLEALIPSQKALLHDEPIKTAYLAYVEGLVADANGDTFKARHRYRAALSAFTRLHLTRRVLVVGLRLAALTHDPDLTAAIIDRASRLPATSWLRSVAERLADCDPLSRLSRAERETLSFLVAGRSTAEIASARGRSPQTVRNTVSKLLHSFGVESRAALVAQYGRMQA